MLITIDKREVRERIGFLVQEVAGGNQSEFARLTGITQQAISNYVNGTAIPDPEELLKISTAGGRSINWILGQDEPPPDHGPELFYKTEKGEIVQYRFTEHELPSRIQEALAIYKKVAADPDLARIMKLLMELYFTRYGPAIKAIEANIEAFLDAAKRVGPGSEKRGMDRRTKK